MERILAILMLNAIVLITGSFGEEMTRIGSIPFAENPKRTLALKKKRETTEASSLESFPSAESCGRSSVITPLIIGGEIVIQGEYPWMVALFHYKNNSLVYKCGATLISNTYVITAAHCTMDQARVHLEFGKHNIDDRFEDHYLSRTSIKIMRHSEYYYTSHADIALISFEPLTFSQWIKPICVWGNFDTKIRWGTVAGWGQENNDGTRSTTPMQANVSMVGLEKCRNSNERLQTAATDKTFCAGGRGTGPCHGDSGGGFYVVRNNIWYLRGITSHSIGNSWSCNVDEYSIYVDLAYFFDWIPKSNKTSLLEPMTSVMSSSLDIVLPLFIGRLAQPTKASWLESVHFAESCGRFSQTTPLVVGRDKVTQGEYPWMVALFHLQNHYWKYTCGATLISDSYVITAAQCTTDQEQVLLEFGKYSIQVTNEKHSLSRTSKQIIHYPEYADLAIGDITLVSFEPINFSEWIKPICLWGNFDTKLGWGIVAGWGQQMNDEPLTTTPIQLNVSMVGIEECRNSDERLRTVATDKLFCAGGRNSGPCHGDSGGGFYVARNNIWYLRGVISQSLRTAWTCNVNEYAVYVDLSYFLDWMRPYLTFDLEISPR